MKEYLQLIVGGLFLQEETYAKMRDVAKPFGKGLVIVAGIGLVVGVLNYIGAIIDYATKPSLEQLKATVFQGLTGMAWYTQLEASREFVTQFKNGYDLFWQYAGSMFVRNPLSVMEISNVVLIPLGLIIGWLIYGLLAHLFARLLRGDGQLGRGLGALALATSPQIFQIVAVIPAGGVGIGVIGLWSLVGNYLALKTAYRLTPARAFWAAILPLVVYAVVILVLALVGFLAIAAAIRGGGR
jgi:hypothetical protein